MKKYLIVGRGRLATHVAHYFQLLKIPYKQWHRKNETPLAQAATEADRVLLLIPDREILRFIHDHPFLKSDFLVHCSGSLHIADAYSAHPLNTFGPELYDLATYKKTPFIIEDGGPELSEILPGLPNPQYKISSEKKSLYHALCVMSGNFTTLLWQNVMNSFEEKLNLPKEALLPYLEQTFINLKQSPNLALTGPLQRHDTETLIRNLDALRGLPEQQLYYAFLNFYLEQQKSKKPEGRYEHLRI